MLFLENVVQIVFESLGFVVRLAGDGDGFALAWCRALFDELLDVVVVDVVCATTSVSGVLQVGWAVSGMMMTVGSHCIPSQPRPCL